ncbi:ABC transporter G family member 20-like isoform X2 [Trichogramma pretiosum]|uniref:ABC transporter G family member 20-like isoform X2 n=1 Tax=Trichogramma pretiosum TaxID=7493 RepID=UPI0006C9B181|nr:ABC transporter G family member 20-like isoform X2 [Trichogramma pretiosum]
MTPHQVHPDQRYTKGDDDENADPSADQLSNQQILEKDLNANNMDQQAIVVRFAKKRYGKNLPCVLDGLNMTVPRGCIYGLLGSSGCGKTTLLSCVVGVRKIDSGDIWVLGGRPGDLSSGIPGPRVGYMPQDISLVGEFSIIGALYYFGRINGLDDHIIDERFDFFSDLLDLPPKDRLVKNLSGGQQRRVSFAAALIHKPELLILDEPTVGLDPVLREKIWQFLVKLTKEENTAVVITTHYIEETRLANKIGLMRNGQLLAETSPDELLSTFHCSTLEEAFLQLSRRQNEEGTKGIVNEAFEGDEASQPASANSRKLRPPISNNPLDILKARALFKALWEMVPFNLRKPRKFWSNPINPKTFRALLIKNCLQFLRHPGTILFAFVFPVVQTTLFFYAVGRDPQGVVVGIVNEEAGNCDWGKNQGQVIYNETLGTCEYRDLSCRFLHGFNESIMVKRYFDTIEDAKHAVTKGQAAAVMHFSKNFSRALEKRRDISAINSNQMTDEEIYTSDIKTMLDMGDRQIGLFLEGSLMKRFIEVHGDIVASCNYPRQIVEVPVFFEEPVFGRVDQRYSDFIAPGFIMTIVFFLSTAVSAAIIIQDRAEGVWDRSLVQGVTTREILFSHIITQSFMIIIQVTMVLCVVFLHFRLDCKGSLLVVIMLTLEVSFSGMSYGFLISTLCNSHTVANFIATGSFYPIILLSGSIWPAEGMPTFLRWFSMTLPTTIPSYAFRALVDKGLFLHEPEVYSGFIVSGIWIVIYIGWCLYSLKKATN